MTPKEVTTLSTTIPHHAGECLHCDALRADAFDDVVRALQVCRKYLASDLCGYISEEQKEAQQYISDAVDAALKKAGVL